MSGKGEEGHPCVQVGEGELLELVWEFTLCVGWGGAEDRGEESRGDKMTW